MEKTEAYQCLGVNDPLPNLIERTNKYLLDLRLAHWITQKQYELLCVKPSEAKLAHLYYLPKTHKPGTPLRPIVSGLKHPTIKISTYLDQLLRPLFNKIGLKTTTTSGFEVMKQVYEWSTTNLRKETLLCTIDVVDLYTMIPQTEGVLAIKKMLDYLELKQIGGLKIETIIRLSRFVMKNNYFLYEGQYYHQIRGGAMGSPLTLTIANCYMFFFERNIVKQITNAGGLYLRYIDDMFIIINWPERHLNKQIDQWNTLDSNIQLKAQAGQSINFLDIYIENINADLFTKVYHKPSYEPYYLPFNSVHPVHMKKNIPFAMFLRAIRYCSTFKAFLDEREDLRMALLLNKYPGKFIDNQFNRVLKKCNITQSLTSNNYNTIRKNIIYNIIEEEKIPTDHYRTMFIHFTYCLNIRTLPTKFHTLWNKYFSESPINEIIPVIGTRNVQNLQKQLKIPNPDPYTPIEFCIFIDNSNVLIGAESIYNKNTGLTEKDPAIRVNVKKLAKVLEDDKLGTDIKSRTVGGSIQPKNAGVWKEWESCGYKCIVGERSESGLEVFMDNMLHALIHDALLGSNDTRTKKVLVLVTGDGNANYGQTNFGNVIERVLKKAWSVELWSWENSLSSTFLRIQRFFPTQMTIKYLDPHRRYITFKAQANKN
ncbi:unnamed protein product [Rotaria socialis]